jgi:hypothetical protein
MVVAVAVVDSTRLLVVLVVRAKTAPYQYNS